MFCCGFSTRLGRRRFDIFRLNRLLVSGLLLILFRLCRLLVGGLLLILLRLSRLLVGRLLLILLGFDCLLISIGVVNLIDDLLHLLHSVLMVGVRLGIFLSLQEHIAGCNCSNQNAENNE